MLRSSRDDGWSGELRVCAGGHQGESHGAEEPTTFKQVALNGIRNDNVSTFGLLQTPATNVRFSPAKRDAIRVTGRVTPDDPEWLRWIIP
jgi:hypothetical protein